MVKFFTALLSFSLATANCFSQTTNSLKEGFLEDLHIYRKVVESSHTGMYLYSPKAVFDSLFTSFQEDVESGAISTNSDFFLHLAAVHTSINCGHSSVYPSQKLFAGIDENQKAFFPLQVKFIQDSLIVSQDYGSIKRGTQIIKINNKSVKQIATDAFRIISSDGFNKTFKYRQLEEAFSLYYFLLYGTEQKYDLEIIPYQSAQTERIVLDAIASDLTNGSEKEEQAVGLSYISDNTVLLTVHTFSTETKRNQRKFFRFLKKSFKEIRGKGIEHLIIDIRENSGGNDGNDMELASYLISGSFKENKYRKLKSIELPVFPEYLHPHWKEMMALAPDKTGDDIRAMFQKEMRREYAQGADSAYYLKEKYTLKRESHKYLFSGKTYILISGKVFSGGALFSALVRDKSKAIFVGEETGGGYYRHTGSIPLIYELPNSKIPFSLFIVINEQDVTQHLFPEGSGIIPHFEVYPSIQDFVESRDVVLNFVLVKLINE